MAKDYYQLLHFSHAEVVTALIKAKDIHEGQWMLQLNFGFGASNVGDSDDNLNPAVFVPVIGIGIRHVTGISNNMTVDAAVVNPGPRPSMAFVATKAPR